MATAQSAIARTRDSSASSSRIRFAGRSSTPLMKWFARGVQRELARNGHGTVRGGEEPTLVVSLLDPSRAVVGLKNHGLIITGRSLDDIFRRVDGKLIRTLPME